MGIVVPIRPGVTTRPAYDNVVPIRPAAQTTAPAPEPVNPWKVIAFVFGGIAVYEFIAYKARQFRNPRVRRVVRRWP